MHDSERLLIHFVKTPGPCLYPVELQHGDDVTNDHQEHDGREKCWQKMPNLPLRESKVVSRTRAFDWCGSREVPSSVLCHPPPHIAPSVIFASFNLSSDQCRMKAQRAK